MTSYIDTIYTIIKIHLRTDYSTFFYIPRKPFLRIVNISNKFCIYDVIRGEGGGVRKDYMITGGI